MAKIRSKLKRNTKGKTWSKGASSTSNPEQMKHRLKARSRFFQPNLSLAPADPGPGANKLTLEAISKHDQRQAFNAETTTVNEVAGSLRSFSLNDDDDNMSESQEGTFKTFKTFASSYSTCTNMSFKKLLTGFRASSDLHKEMLAILTALTEIIKERGGSESSTEYFLLLMEQIEASSEDNDIIAGVSLLAMGIKSVPTPVLRKRFGQTADTLLKCLQRFIEANNQSVLKYIIGSLSVLLRAQDYTTWSYSSTNHYIDAILSFTIHQKPKVRKAAQHAIVSIIHGSCFMLPSKDSSNDETQQEKVTLEAKVTQHPAGSRVTKFCLKQFEPEILANAQTSVLHTLTLLRDVLSGFKIEDIRTICEHLLSIMTAANVLVRTNCFHVLHSLFVSRSKNLNGELCAKLLVAINEYRPDKSDVRQTLAWVTVLKEGHIHLASLDLTLSLNALPKFVDVCANDLWLSDRTEIISGIANCLKEVLYECVKPACENKETADTYVVPIGRIITIMNKVLNAPFGDVAKYVILTFSILFEVTGAYFSEDLAPALINLAKRYDTQSSLRIQIEHAIISAIKAMGPEPVLKAITLTNNKGEVILEKSWLLPLLREGASGATFKFFKDTIIPLALDCNTKWHKYAQEKHFSMSHIFELLCCQLWGLFPGFCRSPKDPENFKLLAPTIGNALDNNPEFRAPIFDGFVELLENQENKKMHELLATYSKNFLPRFFNIYTSKPNGTYEADLRKKSLEVIKLYLTKTPQDVLKELFDTAKRQLFATALCTFEYDAIFDITAALTLHQICDNIYIFFETFMAQILKNEKSKLVAKDEQKLKKQQRKTYELLRDIMQSENPSCKKFTRKFVNDLEKLLLTAFATSCSVCQAARLRCLKMLIESRKSISANDKVIIKAIPESVITFKEYSTKKENISEELITFIANLYQKEGKLNDFVDILTAGFAGDESLITNTILAFRCVVQYQGKNITIQTLEFIMEQILVFLVQKSRSKAEASVAFLISFIKVMPTPLIANHLEAIMRSLSAMAKDTKRYCRIQLGYLLKKLCKRFSAEDLIKFVPGDDEVTHRRLKKLRKQLRRETRKKLNEEKGKDSDEDDSEDEFVPGLEKKSVTIDDILADSDSDLPEDMDDDNDGNTKDKKKSKKDRSTYIKEDPEDIVDLADIKSIGNVLTNKPELPSAAGTSSKTKTKDPNRGFKESEDGRLIISDKALRRLGDDSDGDSGDNDDDDSDDSGHGGDKKKALKRGMEEDSSDEEKAPIISRKRKATDALSLRSGKTSASRYKAGGKGIHRPLGTDAVSMKSGYSAKSGKSTKSSHAPTEYSTKKAKGDMKKKGKLDPYAYIPLSRNTLNKRKRAKHSGTFKNIVNGARKGALKGVKNRIGKSYKKK